MATSDTSTSDMTPREREIKLATNAMQVIRSLTENAIASLERLGGVAEKESDDE